MIFTFFPNFYFRLNSGVKKHKFVCFIPYLSKHASYDHVFCCTSLKWWHVQMLFLFFKILVFWFQHLGRRAKNDPKSQKILFHCVSQELHLIWLWFLVRMCKMMISPTIFFFQNSDFLDFSKFINKCQKEILR